MRASGFPEGEIRMVKGCSTQEELKEAVKLRLRQENSVDGIFGRNDTIACLAMTAAKEIGLSVPKDVKVIGFDDSSISRFCSPTLSTIRVSQQEIAAAAIDMLNQMIGGSQPENMDFDITLIERESTGASQV